ncbi:L-amino acid N-acyltransferase YncA [Streptomyces sp. SAI-229]
MAASRVFGRCTYAGVVEHSVQVHPAARGRGIASALPEALVDPTERAGSFPDNTAGLAVHQRAGFRVIGTRERIGRHHGVWRDVVFVMRRSHAIT